jgi:hypothetical protein
MIGKWIGWYEFDDARVQLLTANMKSRYTIFIDTLTGNSFSGSVQDDPDSSMMHEVGKIEGFLKGDKIYFKKLMPVSYELDATGKQIKKDKPHPPIYYEGVIDGSRTKAKGTWFFKRTIGFMFGFIPIPYRPGRGTWEMELEK